MSEILFSINLQNSYRTNLNEKEIKKNKHFTLLFSDQVIIIITQIAEDSEGCLTLSSDS